MIFRKEFNNNQKSHHLALKFGKNLLSGRGLKRNEVMSDTINLGNEGEFQVFIKILND